MKDPIKALTEIRDVCNGALDRNTYGDRALDDVAQAFLARIEWICRHALEDYRVDPIAFTVGYTPSYDEGLLTGKGNTKMGQTPDYEGGWIWRTAEDARAWLHRPEGFTIDGVTRDPNEFSVYQLDLPNGWAEDASTKPGPDGAHLLLHDARIVAKVLA